MKTPLKLALYLWFLGIAWSAQGQAILGFTNANGFPSVVSQGSHYNLSGWVSNRGNAPFSGIVDLGMLANGVNQISLDNSFSVSSPLQPGDSVFWSRSNFTFPPGQLRLGNNDILIWSTAVVGNGTGCDSLPMQLYSTEGAAFRLSNSGFEVFGAGMDPLETYSLNFFAENLGDGPNSEEVQLLVKIAGQEARVLSEVATVVTNGQMVEFAVPSFNLLEVFDIEQSKFLSDMQDGVDFFVLEEDSELDPFNVVHVDVVVATGNASPTVEEFKLYPNPCQGILQLELPANFGNQARVLVRNLAGQTVYASMVQGGALDLRHLPSGTFMIEISGKNQMAHRLFVKN